MVGVLEPHLRSYVKYMFSFSSRLEARMARVVAISATLLLSSREMHLGEDQEYGNSDRPPNCHD